MAPRLSAKCFTSPVPGMTAVTRESPSKHGCGLAVSHLIWRRVILEFIFTPPQQNAIRRARPIAFPGYALTPTKAQTNLQLQGSNIRQ